MSSCSAHHSTPARILAACRRDLNHSNQSHPVDDLLMRLQQRLLQLPDGVVTFDLAMIENRRQRENTRGKRRDLEELLGVEAR